MTATVARYTAEDLWRMPGDEPRELWEGELRKVPSAGMEASSIGGEIFALLRPTVRTGNLGVLTVADGSYVLSHDPDTVVVPDVAIIRWDRLPGGVRTKTYCPVPPDFAVEVRSPGDRLGEIAAKLDLYQRAGVALVWWVDPETRTVAVHALGRPAVVFGEGVVLDGGGVFPDLRLSVEDIFA